MNDIKDLIYNIRDKQVMLDSDVAKLYHYETKYIIQAMKRNIERFPEDFCFQLTKEEYFKIRSMIFNDSVNENIMNRSQIVTGSILKYRKYLPYVFTEQGIAMLSGLLKGDIAAQVSINIMRVFVEMRKFISNNSNVFERLTTIEYKMLEHDNKFNELFDYLDKEENFKEKIFYEGQIYDAYSLLVEIIKKANKSIIIIDNYIDKTVLDLLSHKNTTVVVKLITNNNKLTELDINKFNEQYPSLDIIYDNSYYDRFIIIDDDIYHLGHH